MEFLINTVDGKTLYTLSVIFGVTSALCLLGGIVLWIFMMWNAEDPEKDFRKNYTDTMKRRLK